MLPLLRTGSERFAWKVVSTFKFRGFAIPKIVLEPSLEVSELCWEGRNVHADLPILRAVAEPRPEIVQWFNFEDSALAREILETHLKDKAFIDCNFSAADISVACQLIGKPPYLPLTLRWLWSCSLHPSMSEIPAPVLAQPLPVKNYSTAVGGRTRVVEIINAGVAAVGQRVTVCGWVRTKREQGGKGNKICFIELNDGSCQASIQIVLDEASQGFEAAVERASTGASVKVHGLCVESPAKGQAVEIAVRAEEGLFISILGDVDASSYPLSKKNHTREYLREIAHLRPRSNLIGAVARVRASMCQAVHAFFKSRNFLYVHTPIITGADCEGAGEMFQVTTLMDSAEKGQKIDYKDDFFGKPSFLTVSGQLSVETYCCALSDVYTFGPTFRAENSHTSRHLAEFWMIEPEMAFADINDDMACAEDFLKFCINWALKDDRADLEFFDKFVDKNGLVARLQDFVKEPFAKISYTEAIEILLRDHGAGKVKFINTKIHWGMDMDSEHERYITEKVTCRPTIVYNYPKDIKAFYMRQNDDGKTVAAMDILVPGIGEVIGGSQREERIERLEGRIKELGMPIEAYWWYLDLRKHGSVPHCGFGLGFERLLMLITGVENIRDVIPFPRYPGHSEF